VATNGSGVPKRGRVSARVDALLPRGDGRSAERRRGDRRHVSLRVSQERRRGEERRGPVPRRETAVGHFFNAAQLLTLAESDPPLTLELVGAALRRLWLGMRELESGNIGWTAESGPPR
jgi:hypothetical protein